MDEYNGIISVEKLTKLLVERNMTTEDLYEKIWMNEKTIQEYVVAGLCDFEDMSRLHSIALALKVDFKELI